MEKSRQKFSLSLFIVLSGIFISALVTCNLIANKFVTIDLGFTVFVVSAGILPYPITFLVTDILSEIYGKRLTNMVVASGFFASMFVLLFLWLGAQPNALNRVSISALNDRPMQIYMINDLAAHDMLDLREQSELTAIFDIRSDSVYTDSRMGAIIQKWNLQDSSLYRYETISKSPIDNETYNLVFQNAWRVILASMVAYLFAQFVDVRMFHFWKNLTNGRHLWLRNNASTIVSQLVDTTLVVCVLFIGVWPKEQIVSAIIDGWTFKMLCAFIDTPLFYASSMLIRKRLGLSLGQEANLRS